MNDFGDVVRPFAKGVRVTIRAKPGTTRTRGVKIVDIGEGKYALEVAVAAEARDGKANKAMMERLAKLLGVDKRAVTIKTGESGKIKIVEVVGDTGVLMARFVSKGFVDCN